jgi:hypothetical protein
MEFALGQCKIIHASNSAKGNIRCTLGVLVTHREEIYWALLHTPTFDRGECSCTKTIAG